MARLARKNLYAAEVYDDCLSRIERLTRDTPSRWGTMSVAQMLAHCAEVQEVSNGAALKNTPWAVKLLRGLVRKMVLSEKPYPRNTRTHPQYRQTVDRDFEVEKRRLLAALDRFVHASAEERRTPHPLFGVMSDEEKGWAMYKHLDHHLTQFGV